MPIGLSLSQLYSSLQLSLFIRESSAGVHYWTFCLLSQTWNHSSICHYISLFYLGTWTLFSLLSYNLSLFLLLSFQFLPKLIACSYHWLIILGWCSDSMSFHQMVLFILHLNFSINNYSSCLLSLTVFLNLYKLFYCLFFLFQYFQFCNFNCLFISSSKIIFQIC